MAILESDADRGGELFLRLPVPCAHIRITPPRKSDVSAVIPYLNDMKIAQWLTGPPYPYALEDYEDFHPATIEQCAQSATQYWERRATQSNNGDWLAALPVRSIRDTQAGDHRWNDRDQLFIGDVDIHRASFSEVIDLQEREKLKQENDSYPDGDERILWEIGDYLAPSHWGQGIMSAAIKTIIEAAVTYLNAHTIQISYYSGNIASRKTFEKNGFVPFGIVHNAVKMPESKGGKTVDLGLMRWNRTSDSCMVVSAFKLEHDH